MGRSALNIIQAFSPSGDLTEGVQVIADLRGITLEQEIAQLTGAEPDLLAAEARGGDEFWEGAAFTDVAVSLAKVALGYFTGPIGPALITVAQQATTDEGLTLENLGPVAAKVAVSTIADSDLDFSLGLSIGDDAMGFFDDIGSAFGDNFSSIGSSFGDFIGDVSFSDVLSAGTPIVSSLISGNNTPQMYQTLAPASQVVKSALPSVMGGAVRAGSVVGRSFFNKFPNLATAIQKFRNVGQNVSRAQLYSLLKRFGPDFLITGGILTAAAVSELMVAGAGRRRMNPGNVKALRRSMRRVESFHHLCGKADKLRRPKARRISSCK